VFSRCFTRMCMLLTRAAHVLCAAALSDCGHSVPLWSCMIPNLLSTADIVPRSAQKIRAHFIPVPCRTTSEQPGLQAVRGWLCTRCHRREVARLGAWQAVESSVSMWRTESLMELCCHCDHVCCVALRLLLVQWRLHTVWSECWSSCVVHRRPMGQCVVKRDSMFTVTLLY